MPARIHIVLATRNGREYLAEQIESILAQDESDWALLIRDDCSSDGTDSLIAEYEARDSRIEQLDNGGRPSGSAMANFARLLEEAARRDARYVFCCDQDDVWSPDKLTIMLTELERAERDESTPVLVHHDLAIVDEKLELREASYWQAMRIVPRDEAAAQRFLSRNEVTGCAMAFNRALLEIALPLPGEAIMHDWWLALCAAYFGRLRFTGKRLVRYRQHADNAIGAKSFWAGLAPDAAIRNWRAGNAEFAATVRQARSFLQRHRNRLSPRQLAEITDYASLLESGRLKRLQLMARSGAWRKHWLLNATLIARLLTMKNR